MRRALPLATPQNNSLRNASPSSCASLMPHRAFGLTETDRRTVENQRPNSNQPHPVLPSRAIALMARTSQLPFPFEASNFDFDVIAHNTDGITGNPDGSRRANDFTGRNVVGCAV